MSVTKFKFISSIIFILILGIAAMFRFTGINWDQGHYLNPDERFLIMVTTAMKWPNTIGEYFSTTTSQLNPHNIGHTFYVYGTWPVIFVKFVGTMFGYTNYGNIHVVGRVLSGFTDLLTLICVYFITKRLTHLFIKRKETSFSPNSQQMLPITAGLVASFIYAIMLLPIQLSHFFTVDPYVVLGLSITMLILTYSPTFFTGMLAGTAFAFAMSAKISAAPALIIIATYSLLFLVHHHKSKDITQFIKFILFFCVFFYCFFRILMPYLFTDNALFTINPKVVHNWKELQLFNNPDAWFPPGVQWIHTKSILFPAIQLTILGLGIPLTILSWASIIWALTNIRSFGKLLIPLSLIGGIFFYQGIQYAIPLRYFWPIFPSLSIIIGIGISLYLGSHRTRLHLKLFNTQIRIIVLFFFTMTFILLNCSFLWTFSYLSIYTNRHTRVQASEWIYANIPTNSIISSEHWDDGLPLNLGTTQINSMYQTIELPMYAPDTKAKWMEMLTKLDTIDYIILSSNRVYGSITSAPEKYPVSTSYYQQLFSGNLGFRPIAQFISRPSLSLPFIHTCLDIPLFTYGRVDALLPTNSIQYPNSSSCSGLTFIDDYGEESFTVYDHPKVTIFKKTSEYQTPNFLVSLAVD